MQHRRSLWLSYCTSGTSVSALDKQLESLQTLLIVLQESKQHTNPIESEAILCFLQQVCLQKELQKYDSTQPQSLSSIAHWLNWLNFRLLHQTERMEMRLLKLWRFRFIELPFVNNHLYWMALSGDFTLSYAALINNAQV